MVIDSVSWCYSMLTIFSCGFRMLRMIGYLDGLTLDLSLLILPFNQSSLVSVNIFRPVGPWISKWFLWFFFLWMIEFVKPIPSQSNPKLFQIRFCLYKLNYSRLFWLFEHTICFSHQSGCMIIRISFKCLWFSQFLSTDRDDHLKF